MRKLPALALSLGLLVASPAFAQMPPKIEFDEAVRRAIDQNPTVAEAAANIRRAEALLTQSRSITQPFVALGLTNTTLDGSRGFDGGVTQPQNQSVFSASVGMPVLSLARWATIDQARDQIDVATRSTADVRQTIAVAAASAYLRVIAIRRQVEVDERALENSRAHLDYAQKRLEGGAGSRLNQLRAAQQVAADQSRLEVTRLAPAVRPGGARRRRRGRWTDRRGRGADVRGRDGRDRSRLDRRADGSAVSGLRAARR